MGRGINEYWSNGNLLYQRVRFTRRILLYGFLKSTLGTTLISLSISIFAIKFFERVITVNPDWAFVIGIIILGLGLFVYMLGDFFQAKEKEQELTEIQKEIKESSSELFNRLNSDADKVKDDFIRNKLRDLEDAICNGNLSELCNKHEVKVDVDDVVCALCNQEKDLCQDKIKLDAIKQVLDEQNKRKQIDKELKEKERKWRRI